MPLGESVIDEDEHEAAMAAMQQAGFAKLLDPDYTFETWRGERRTEFREQVSAWDLMGENLGLFDVVFALLGLSTAFGVVQQAAQRGS